MQDIYILCINAYNIYFLADLKASRQAGGREAVGIDGDAHELAMIRAQVCVCVCLCLCVCVMCVCGVRVDGWVAGWVGGVCVV
jgi:hypothetical protein